MPIIGWLMIAAFFAGLFWFISTVMPVKEVALMFCVSIAVTGFLFVAAKLIGGGL